MNARLAMTHAKLDAMEGASERDVPRRRDIAERAVIVFLQQLEQQGDAMVYPSSLLREIFGDDDNQSVTLFTPPRP